MKMRNVAIIGTGQVKHGIRRDINLAEMIGRAARRAMDDAGITPDEVDAITSGNMPGFVGTNMTKLWSGDWYGAPGKPALRISTGGTTGGSVAQGGYYHVASGLYDIVLSIGFERHSDSKEPGATLGLAHTSMADIFHLLNYSPNIKRFVALAGGAGGGAAAGLATMQAAEYMKRSGCSIEHFDMVAAKDRRNAAKNPYAHLQRPGCTPDDIAETRMLVYPMRFGHVCPASDGASAVVYAEENVAKEKAEKPAWILGCASFADAPNRWQESMQGVAVKGTAEQLGCRVSARMAYKRADIKDPKKEIDVAEIYQPFPNQELMYAERLGLLDEGEAWKVLEEGQTEMDGDMPCDPSGGVNATNAIGSSAMQRVLECALQIMGKAGEHQVPKDVEKAVAHGWGGQSQYNTVTVLGDSPRW